VNARGNDRTSRYQSTPSRRVGFRKSCEKRFDALALTTNLLFAAASLPVITLARATSADRVQSEWSESGALLAMAGIVRSLRLIGANGRVLRVKSLRSAGDRPTVLIPSTTPPPVSRRHRAAHAAAIADE